MDQPEYPAGKSPRRELQGPRPAPLKVRKDSHKIRKPPVAPTNQSHPPPHHHNHPQHRQPVIIYTVSPKIIHTDPSEFMSLVQRLTGSSSSSTSTSTSTSDFDSGLISPAARFAAMEKTNKPSELKQQQLQLGGCSSSNDFAAGIDVSAEIERSSLFPGILSPGPGALPTIPSNFFSPPSDQNHHHNHHNNEMNFFHDLSPVLQGNRSYLDSSFLTSPSPTFFSISPHITSPTASLDLFNNFFDS